MSDSLLPDWLRRRAHGSPDHEAIVCGDDAWSFAEFDRRVDLAVSNLAAVGVRPGDRVALLGANSAAYAQLIFGVVRLGATLVPLNLRLAQGEIEWQLGDCEPSLLLTDRPQFLEGGADGVKVMSINEASLYAGAPRVETPEFFDAEAVHSIIYTSGTTGRPKGALLTHGNFFWSAMGSVAQLGLHADDRWLAVLPLFHVGGLSILNRGVLNGTTSVIHESFDPARVNRAIDAEGVTIISLVSTMLTRMLEARSDAPYPSTLRCVLLGGGPVPQELVDKGLQLGIPIAQTYGLTETASQATTLRLDELTRKAGSAGKPLLVTQISVEREDGTPCAADEPGEIVVRGSNISRGYFRREGARGPLDWFHTGDAGYLDAEGYLYVLDRRDDMVVSGGENVYPAEIESVLSTHPSIREAGAFGLPDATWGQVVAVAVALREGESLTDADVQSYCRERMAGYKTPRVVHFVEELPRNASGKLLRRELRRIYAPD